MLHINQDNYSGFEIIFSNGWKISVQFGTGTLSQNENVVEYQDSTDAEVRIWDNTGIPYIFESIGSPILPYVPSDKISDLMMFVRNQEAV